MNFCWFWNGFSIFLFLIKIYIYIYIYIYLLRKDYIMSKGHEGAKKITKDYVWKYKSENVAIESQCAKPHPWDQSNKELKKFLTTDSRTLRIFICTLILFPLNSPLHTYGNFQCNQMLENYFQRNNQRTENRSLFTKIFSAKENVLCWNKWSHIGMKATLPTFLIK